MSPVRQLEPAALAVGLSKKRNNAIAALLAGILPALILGYHLPFSWLRVVIGFVIGLFWANAFEYAYHRWLLHWPKSEFGKGHLRHHMTTGMPQEPEHVTLGSSPWAVVALFVINGVPLIALDLTLRLGVSPAIFLAWSVYFIVLEEVHWRIHLGPRLPKVLRFAEAYHLSHHDIPAERFNVFLPVCDAIFRSSAGTLIPASCKPHKQQRTN